MSHARSRMICTVVGLLGGLGALAASAAAEACVPEVAATLGGRARDVDTDNGLAYMVRGDQLIIADIVEVFVPKDPERGDFFADQLMELGRTDVSALPLAIDVQGNLAYVATDSGLEIFNVSDPAAPAALGTLATPGRGTDIAVEGNLVILTDTFGVTVVDASNPLAPVSAGFSNFADPPVAVSLKDGLAYIVTSSDNIGQSMLFVFDPSNPADLDLIGSTALPLSPSDIDTQGSFAYVTDFEGLTVYAIVNPEAPVQLGNKLFFEGTNAVDVQGALAYVATERDGVFVLDVSHPAFPFLATQSFVFGAGAVSGVSFDGNDLYYSADIGLVSEPSFPALPRADRGFFGEGDENPLILAELGGALEVVVQNDRAYMLSSSGVWVIDIADPDNPVTIGLAELQSFGVETRGLSVENGFAYATIGFEGLAIFDLRDENDLQQVEEFFIEPPQPRAAERGFNPLEAYDIVVEGGLAYVVGVIEAFERGGPSFDDAFAIVSVLNPFDPIVIGGTSKLMSTPSRVAVGDGHAYLADGGGITTLDVANPTFPFLDGFSLEGFPDDIAYQDGFAYTVAGDLLRIYDVSFPSFPSITDSVMLFTNQAPKALAVEDDRAYVGLLDAFHVVNISDPSEPFVAADLFFPSDAVALDAQDGYVYIADAQRGLVVIDTTMCSQTGNPADLNGDGVVDSFDLAALLAAWGASGGAADLDSDGVVGSFDLAIVLAAWE